MSPASTSLFTDSTGSAGSARPRRILVVDDEPTIRRVVQAYLEKEGFTVVAVNDGPAAWEVFGQEDADPQQRPDLVILDLMLPGISGWELCRRMQVVAPHVPIILLTARGEETDRIVGLRLGADDYVSKPFSPAELVARVQAVLRRVEQGRQQAATTAAPPPAGIASPASVALRLGPLTIDSRTFQVWVHDRSVPLTATEFRLLERLARHPLQVFTRSQLLEATAGDVFAGYERNVDTHIKNLRHKLAQAGLAKSPIETVYRVGYRFRPPAGR